MEITRRRRDDIVEVELAGRLDGYWCDHLDSALAEVLRDGDHHIRVDCSQVSYLTSAGIGVLVRVYKELQRIHGTFHVVNPSASVRMVLRTTRLDNVLILPTGEGSAPPERERPARRLEHQGVGLEVFDLDGRGTLTCRTVGTAGPLAQGAFGEEHCTSFEGTMPALAVGVGAFGASFADCRGRFGELLSVAGATAYQPGDGTNVADYLVSGDGLGGDIRVLYCLACEGRFSHLVRFEALQQGSDVALSQVLAGCFEAAASDSLGVVLVAEATGLVGAALRRSPTEPVHAGGFFDHPAVRTRLTFTSERAFPGSVVLAGGVVTRAAWTGSPAGEHLRPMGKNTAGHFHAAAFRFRPLRKGAIDLGETVTGLFEPEQLLGVLHLLCDDRVTPGPAESEFVRGACWIGPIGDRWPAA
jgi:anti-anti-sigma factor